MAPGSEGRGEEGGGGRAACRSRGRRRSAFPRFQQRRARRGARSFPGAAGRVSLSSYGVLKPEVGCQPERFPVLSLLRLSYYDAGSAHAGIGGAGAHPEEHTWGCKGTRS